MKLIVLFLFFVVTLSACNKNFDHEAIYPEYHCECCLFTDSLEGNYEGLYRHIEFTGLNGTVAQLDTIVDSFAVLNVAKAAPEDYITDVLECKFDLSGAFTGSGFINRITYEELSMGVTYDWVIDLSNNTEFWSDSTLKYSKLTHYEDSNGNTVNYYSIQFEGIKQ